jgi:hypothetical protein
MENAACVAGIEIRVKSGGDCDPPAFKPFDRQNQALTKQSTEPPSRLGQLSIYKYFCRPLTSLPRVNNS